MQSQSEKEKKISDFNFSTVYFYSIYSAAVRKHILYYKKILKHARVSEYVENLVRLHDYSHTYTVYFLL